MIALLVLPILFVVSIFWEGYVSSVLWGWFIVPAGFAPAITVLQASGIACVLSSFLGARGINFNESDGENASAALARACAKVLVIPAVSLITGWFIKIMM